MMRKIRCVKYVYRMAQNLILYTRRIEYALHTRVAKPIGGNALVVSIRHVWFGR